MSLRLKQRITPLAWQRWCDFSPLFFGVGLLIPYGMSVALSPVMFGILMLAAIVLTRTYAGRPLHFQVSLSVVIVLAGITYSTLHIQHMQTSVLSRTYTMLRFTATVGAIIQGEERQKLILYNLQGERLSEADAKTTLRLSMRAEVAGLKVGDHLRLLATIFPPSRPSYPGGFDFGRYFAMRSIGGVGYILGKPVIIEAAPPHMLQPHIWNTWFESADAQFAQWRDSIQHYIMHLLPQPEAGITLALITGQQERIESDAKRVMQISSLAHMLAISGMNLVIACGMVFFLTRLCLAAIPTFATHLPIKQIAALCALISGGMYLWLADNPISAARAYVMIAFFFLAILCNREADTLRSLVLSAWIIMLANPQSVTEISFQLSYTATLALILVYRRVRLMNASMRAKEKGVGWRILAYIGQMAFTSLVAGLATAPLMIYHFNQFTPYGILANVLASPPITFITSPALIAALFFAPFGLADYPMYIASYGVAMMVWVAHMTAAIPYASITLPSISTIALILMFAVLCAMLLLRKPVYLTLGAIGLLLLATSGSLRSSPDILISEDGSAIAVKQELHRWLLLKGTMRNFHVSQWMQATTDQFTPFAKAYKNGSVVDWQCEDHWCDGTVAGKVMRVGFDYHTKAPLCLPNTDIVITTFYSNRWFCNTQNVVRIDRDALQKKGSYALWVSEGEAPQIWYSCVDKAHQPWMRCSEE